MSIRTLLTSTALSAAIGLTSGLALAQSATATEDAAIKADEAAEAKAMAAEAAEEAKVAKEKAMEAQGEQFEKEEVGGITDFNNN